jgi:hypothetical protein
MKESIYDAEDIDSSMSRSVYERLSDKKTWSAFKDGFYDAFGSKRIKKPSNKT